MTISASLLLFLVVCFTSISAFLTTTEENAETTGTFQAEDFILPSNKSLSNLQDSVTGLEEIESHFPTNCNGLMNSHLYTIRLQNSYVDLKCLRLFDQMWMVMAKSVQNGADMVETVFLRNFINKIGASNGMASTSTFSIPLRFVVDKPVELVFGFGSTVNEVWGIKIPDNINKDELFDTVDNAQERTTIQGFVSPDGINRYGLNYNSEKNTLISNRRDSAAGGVDMANYGSGGGTSAAFGMYRNTDSHKCFVGRCNEYQTNAAYNGDSSSYYTDYAASLNPALSRKGTQSIWVALRVELY